jgi:hypothetical protein
MPRIFPLLGGDRSKSPPTLALPPTVLLARELPSNLPRKGPASRRGKGRCRPRGSFLPSLPRRGVLMSGVSFACCARCSRKLHTTFFCRQCRQPFWSVDCYRSHQAQHSVRPEAIEERLRSGDRSRSLARSMVGSESKAAIACSQRRSRFCRSADRRASRCRRRSSCTMAGGSRYGRACRDCWCAMRRIGRDGAALNNTGAGAAGAVRAMPSIRPLNRMATSTSRLPATVAGWRIYEHSSSP